MRVFAFCSNDGDVTSFYRGIVPLAVLEKQMPDLRVNYTWADGVEINANRLRFCDVLFFQRPVIPAHADLIKLARDVGIPVWVDYDDDPFSIPHDSPAREFHDKPEVQEAIKQSFKLASVISVSTPALKEAIAPYNPAVVVIPNALDDELIAWKRHPGKNRKVVLWRGSATHQKDLLDVVGNLDDEGREFPDWYWVFMGYHPWFLTRSLPKERTMVVPWLPGMVPYMQKLQAYSPDIVIVPLVDHAFNRSKSNIAWIEASAAGAAVIAPDLPEWDRPGVIRYRGKEGFHECLKQALSDEIDLAACAKASWEYIWEKLRLTKVNRLRLELLRSL